MWELPKKQGHLRTQDKKISPTQTPQQDPKIFKLLNSPHDHINSEPALHQPQSPVKELYESPSRTSPVLLVAGEGLRHGDLRPCHGRGLAFLDVGAPETEEALKSQGAPNLCGLEGLPICWGTGLLEAEV